MSQRILSQFIYSLKLFVHLHTKVFKMRFLSVDGVQNVQCFKEKTLMLENVVKFSPTNFIFTLGFEDSRKKCPDFRRTGFKVFHFMKTKELFENIIINHFFTFNSFMNSFEQFVYLVLVHLKFISCAVLKQNSK